VASRQQIGNTPDTTAVDFNKVRTLLLDDSPFDRERIKRICRKAGLQLSIDEVSDLAGLAQALHTRKFDLVLIDYHLPTGDGLDALENVFGSPFNQDAAKIMISGSDDASLARRALEVGCHDFLLKNDLTFDEFRKSVERSLIHARRWTSGSAPRSETKPFNPLDQVEEVIETSVQSTVDVLRSEWESHRRLMSAGQSVSPPEILAGLHNEYVEQERLNSLLQRYQAEAETK